MAGIFGKADFSKESNAKQTVYHQILATKKCDGNVVSFSGELNEEELHMVTAAGELNGAAIQENRNTSHRII